MRGHFRSALALAALCPGAAAAIDLDALSRYDRRLACVAYAFIDVNMRYEAGGIDKATFEAQRNAVIWKVQNRGDNFNYAPDMRRVDRFIDQIIAEDPPLPEFAGKVTACRALLRL